MRRSGQSGQSGSEEDLAQRHAGTLPRLVTLVIVVLTTAVIVVAALEDDATPPSVVGAGLAAIAVFALGVVLVIASERWLSRDTARQDAIELLLREASQWLKIVRSDPPPGWATVVDLQGESIQEYRTTAAGTRLDDETAHSMTDSLAIYCLKMRDLYKGLSATEILATRGNHQ